MPRSQLRVPQPEQRPPQGASGGEPRALGWATGTAWQAGTKPGAAAARAACGSPPAGAPGPGAAGGPGTPPGRVPAESPRRAAASPESRALPRLPRPVQPSVLCLPPTDVSVFVTKQVSKKLDGGKSGKVNPPRQLLALGAFERHL